MTNDYSIKPDILPIRRNLVIISFIIIFIVISNSNISHIGYPFFKIEDGYFSDSLLGWIVMATLFFYWSFRYILALDLHRDNIQKIYNEQFLKSMPRITQLEAEYKPFQDEVSDSTKVKLKFQRNIASKWIVKYQKYFCFPLNYLHSIEKDSLKYTELYLMLDPRVCKVCMEDKWILFFKLIKSRILCTYFWDYDFPLIMGWFAFLCLLIRCIITI